MCGLIDCVPLLSPQFYTEDRRHVITILPIKRASKIKHRVYTYWWLPKLFLNKMEPRIASISLLSCLDHWLTRGKQTLEEPPEADHY